MGVKDAVRSRDGAVLVDVTVTPSADEAAFPAGYNEWRDRFEARVEEQARDGQANAALCKLVADALDVKVRQVAVHRGQTSRRKTLAIHGAAIEEIRSLLEDVTER